jgi:hypothetical protein
MDHLIFAKFLFLFLFIYFINLRNMIIYVILDILTSFYFSGFANYLKWNSGLELELYFSCIVKLLDLDLRTDIDQVVRNGSEDRKGVG